MSTKGDVVGGHIGHAHRGGGGTRRYTQLLISCTLALYPRITHAVTVHPHVTSGGEEDEGSYAGLTATLAATLKTLNFESRHSPFSFLPSWSHP